MENRNRLYHGQASAFVRSLENQGLSPELAQQVIESKDLAERIMLFLDQIKIFKEVAVFKNIEIKKDFVTNDFLEHLNGMKFWWNEHDKIGGVHNYLYRAIWPQMNLKDEMYDAVFVNLTQSVGLQGVVDYILSKGGILPGRDGLCVLLSSRNLKEIGEIVNPEKDEDKQCWLIGYDTKERAQFCSTSLELPAIEFYPYAEPNTFQTVSIDGLGEDTETFFYFIPSN